MITKKAPKKAPKKAAARSCGKRTKLIDEVQEAIVLSVKSGSPLQVAAAAAGVSANTVSEWIRRGEGIDDRPVVPRYAAFAKEIEKARAIACDHAVGVVHAAMSKSWQAAAWFLERTMPEHFALKTKTELTGKDGAALIPANVDMSKFTDEELQRIATGDISSLAGKS